MIVPECQSPLPSNRHHRRNDDCLEGKRENYQVCFVQYCVQQLCIMQCTHIWTDLTVVCWLDLAFLWLYCVLHFICVRFSFLGLLCVRPIVYLLCMCFCCVGSRPSDHYFRSVCLSVCLLFVCAEFFSAVFDPISIKLGHTLFVWV